MIYTESVLYALAPMFGRFVCRGAELGTALYSVCVDV
jgi:hypothetical protein